MNIKLIIFDLDGVLIETKKLHYETLNKALMDIDRKYIIDEAEHLLKYDGLSTNKKLILLTKEKQLNPKYYEQIWKNKQKFTLEKLKELKSDLRIKKIFKKLKDNNYQIAVASNSIRETVKITLLKLNLFEYVDFFLSNEDVKNPKPNPEIYLKAMIDAGVSPKETLIIEDSVIGRRAANESGAYLYGINSPKEVKYENIINYIKQKNTNYKKPKWQAGKMNILIPMAGAGSRFEKAGYSFPKPLIDVNGKPMIQEVVDNLNIEGKYIFIVQKSHYLKFNLKETLNLIAPNCEIVQVDGLTEGAACTTLIAKKLIDNNHPLLIANSDQYVEWNNEEFIYSMASNSIDGGILTFKSTHPKWSYVKIDKNELVCEVAEKKPISDIATVGIYFWKKGCDYVKYAEQMISKNIRTNGEFYICPVYNEAIQDNKKIKTFNIEKMWGLGTPEDLKTFLENKK